MPRRYDGELVKTSKIREMEFHIMLTRDESIIYYDTKVDLTKTLAFIEKYNKGKEKKDQITLFYIFLAACVRTIACRYKINRFVAGRRLWQRNQILLSFIVKKELTEEGEEIVATVEYDPFDTLKEVHKKSYERIYEARFGENKLEKDIKLFSLIPRWFLKALYAFARWMHNHNMPIKGLTGRLPFFCTFFVANLGSIGIDAVYHHLYELGTASVFLNFGNIYKAALVNQETEEIEIKPVIDLRASIDDRIAGGGYTGPTVHLLEDLIANPERLLEPPELTDEQLDKLMLKKYKKERLERKKKRKKEARRKRRKKRKKE
jgi:hypothetical protein